MRGCINGRAGETNERGVWNARHQVVAQITLGGAVGLVDQHVNVGPGIQVSRHVREFLDRRDDDAAIVILQQRIECVDAGGRLHVVQTQCLQVSYHLVFQLVAVDEQQDGWLFRLRRFEQHLGGLDHREGLAAALGMPNHPPTRGRMVGALHHLFYGAGLVLTQDELLQF